MRRAQDLLPQINLYLTLVSAACALVTLLLITWGRISATRGEMNRVSIRLVQGTSLVIFLKALVMLVLIFTSNSGTVCTGLSFVVHWLSLLYVFFGVSIAVNLHFVALRGARPDPFREALCWILPLMVATLLIGAPLRKLGQDNDTLSCEFRNRKSTSTQIWIWTCFLAWIPASCIYCTYIVLKLMFGQGLAVAFDPVEYEKQSTDTNLFALICDLKTLVHRIAFYCLIPIITQTGFFANTAYALLRGTSNLTLVYISVIGTGTKHCCFKLTQTGLTGILTLLGFLMDPSLYGLIRSSRHKRCNQTPYASMGFPSRTLSNASLISKPSKECLSPRKLVAKSILNWGDQIEYLRKSLPPLPCCREIPPHPLTPNCQFCPDDIKLFVQNL